MKVDKKLLKTIIITSIPETITTPNRKDLLWDIIDSNFISPNNLHLVKRAVATTAVSGDKGSALVMDILKANGDWDGTTGHNLVPFVIYLAQGAIGVPQR